MVSNLRDYRIFFVNFSLISSIFKFISISLTRLLALRSLLKTRTRHVCILVPSISHCLPHCVYPTISCCVLIFISMFFCCLIIRIHQTRGKSLWKPGTVVPAPLPSLSSMTLLCFSLVPNSTHPNHSSCPQMS